MKSRILFILHMPPPVHGAAMVGKYIHDSELINSKFECRYINLTTASSLEDIGRVSLSKLKAFVRLVCHIRREVKTFRPQLVYITPNAKDGAFYKDFIVVEMLKMMGCRVVAHYHNKGVSTRQDRWLDNLLYRKFFKDIKVILLGRSLYKDVEKYVKWEDVFICPNGIPVTSTLLPEKKANPIPRLLFLSNLLESKGVFVLLDALRILKDKGYSFICDFVGGETAEIDAHRFEEEVRKRGLNEIALYHGRKGGEEKDAAIESCDVFVLPTQNDCFPLVLLEAMSHGKPVVTTPIGAIPDIVDDGKNGIIDEKVTAVTFSDCIKHLFDNKQLIAEYGENGKRKYLMKFTDSQFEKSFYDVIKSAFLGGKLALCLYHGKKFGKEKDEAYQQTDIFVFPTYYHNECFPLVLLEAMQHGLPCISTNEGAISDIVDDGVTGYVVEARNAGHLAAKIEELLNDKQQRMDMGENGYRKCQEQFTLDVFEKRMSEVLEQLM